MNSIEIIILLGFDIANMKSVNNARARKHAYLYTNITTTLQTYFCIYFNIYEMKLFLFIYNS